MRLQLLEIKRKEHILSSKNSDPYKSDLSKGKNRYERRLHLKVLKSTRELNLIDMNKFFKEGILDVNIKVTGETDEYTVTISFGELLDDLHDELSKNNNELSLRVLIRSIVKSFNLSDVLLRCTCPDFRYRIAAPLSKKDAIYGDKETRPANITNPNDTKGNGCKHIMSVLSNNRWITSLASVIWNYINYMKDNYENAYAKVIYPAVYKKEYEEPVQQGLFDTDELADKGSEETSKAVGYNLKKTLFKPGNEYRFLKDANDLMKGQQSLDFDKEIKNLISER